MAPYPTLSHPTNANANTHPDDRRYQTLNLVTIL
jgi:hypothetical protein